MHGHSIHDPCGPATMGSRPMVYTASMPAPAVNPGKPTAPVTASTPAATATATPAAATSAATPFGKCRTVRDDAKRANRNAGRQNSYRSLGHGTLPTRNSKAVGVAAPATTARTSPHLTFITTVSAASF